MIDVTVLFLNGGYVSTAVNAIEIFRSAGVIWNALGNGSPAPKFRVTTASPGGKTVTPDGPMRLTPDRALDDIGRSDLIFVPAAGFDLEMLATVGYDIDTVIARNADVVPWLRAQADQGAEIAAVCSGVALVAEAGLLAGRQGTMHWAFARHYAERFPDVDWQADYLVTDSGGIYCGGGINSASDLSLYLVEKFCGREVAVQCAKAMLIEMPRIWQVAFAHLDIGARHDDEAIQRAQERLHRNHRCDVQLEPLAREIGMSPRNFIRRFKAATGLTPLVYLQKLRIARAKRLLENGDARIQAVCDAVGYDDPIFFRNLFKRHTGLTPQDYRRRFGG